MEQGKHNCNAATDLNFVAVYGAPGIGQAWGCRECKASWTKIGDTFFRNDEIEGEGPHILTQNDVI